MLDTGVVTGSASGQPSHTHRLRELADTGFIATLAAMVATTPRRRAGPGRWRRLRRPSWWRDDPVVRVRHGHRLLLGRGHRHCRRSSSLERSPRRAIRADGSVADHDLAGPTPPLRGKHQHRHRPRRATPRRCNGDDPHPGAEPLHPDRLTIVSRRLPDPRGGRRSHAAAACAQRRTFAPLTLRRPGGCATSSTATSPVTPRWVGLRGHIRRDRRPAPGRGGRRDTGDRPGHGNPGGRLETAGVLRHPDRRQALIHGRAAQSRPRSVSAGGSW